MDLLAALRRKLLTLPVGDHTAGLRAVEGHIESAINHYARGQDTGEESAYTDVIYRTNQAFEGSIKEAYRVLAARDPAGQRPYDIEIFLEQNNVLRPRVLSQFKIYRQDWRNPSAHDHKLHFDESEALLGIVGVCAFSCVLADEIAERLAFIASSGVAIDQRKTIEFKDALGAIPLVDLVTGIVMMLNHELLELKVLEVQTDSQLVGTVHGYLTMVLPTLKVTPDARVLDGYKERADLLVEYGNERVVVELSRSNTRGSLRTGMTRLEGLMGAGAIQHGVIYVFKPGVGPLKQFVLPFMGKGGGIQLLVPIAPENGSASADDITGDSENAVAG